MNDKFQIKYLKYQKKYQQLKNIIGGNWRCQICTYINKTDDHFCEICEKLNFEMDEPLPFGSAAASPEEGLPLNQVSSTYSTLSPNPEFKIDVFLKEIEKDYRNPNLFIIFTTGMADRNVREFWFEKNYKMHLLSLIPSNFNEIKFIHFDPDITFNKLTNINQTDIERINLQALESDRIIESSFYKANFPFLKIEFQYLKHIVIDYAHLFKYEQHSNGIVKTSGHYLVEGQDYLEGLPIDYMKSVYFLYGSESSKKLSLSNFFMFDERGELITFIEKLFERGLKINELYPSDIIQNLVDEAIKIIFYKLYKVTYKGPENMNLFDINFTNNTDINSKLFLLFFNEYLWSNLTIDDFKRDLIEYLIKYSKSIGFKI